MVAFIVFILGMLFVPLALIVRFGLLSAPRAETSDGRGAPRAPRSSSFQDRPSRTAAAAIARLPRDRAEWGRGMRAELAALPPGPDRRRFAAGIVRVALGAWLREWARSPIAISVLIASAGTIVGSRLLLPQTQLFTLAAMVMLNVYAAIALTFGAQIRAERSAVRTPLARSLRTLVFTGIVAVMVLTIYAITVHPVPDRSPGAFDFSSILMAGIAVAYIAFAVAPPFAVDRTGLRGGAVGGAICVLIWAGPAVAGMVDDRGLSAYSFYASLFVPLLVAKATALRARSVGAGIQAGLWTGMISGLAMYLTAIIALLVMRHNNPDDIVHWQNSGAATMADYVVNDGLDGPMWGIQFLPLLAWAFAAVGASATLDFWIGGGEKRRVAELGEPVEPVATPASHESPA
jgi:hypothetical protein